MTFQGASVLVTGGSRGIGKAIALRFASLGATQVAIGYMRGDTAAEETASELRALGAEPILVRGNVASTRVAEKVAELGPLDVLVHAAASGVIRPALETEDKHWDWTHSANARALLSLARVAVPSMPAGLQRGRSDLVFATGRSLAGAADLEAWAAGIATVLRPDGELILNAEHPVLACLDEVLRWHGDYFAEDAAPRVGQVVTVLIAAGLELRLLEELPEFPPLRPQASRAPGQLLVVAAKPA